MKLLKLAAVTAILSISVVNAMSTGASNPSLNVGSMTIFMDQTVAIQQDDAKTVIKNLDKLELKSITYDKSFLVSINSGRYIKCRNEASKIVTVTEYDNNSMLNQGQLRQVSTKTYRFTRKGVNVKLELADAKYIKPFGKCGFTFKPLNSDD